MYNVTVKIEGIENGRRSAGLLHVVIGLFLITKSADYYKFLDYKNFLPVMPFLLVGSFSLFYGLFRKKIDLTFRYNAWIRALQVLSFGILGVLTMKIGRPMDYTGDFVFSFLSLMLLLTERRIFEETTIYLNEEGVKIPGYYRDHFFPWEDFTDVIVREDFITFFHVRQRYLQYQVLQDLSTLEVAKLNAFCREQIGLRREEEQKETLAETSRHKKND